MNSMEKYVYIEINWKGGFLMFRLLRRKNNNKQRGKDRSWRLILDVGTEFMKAGIICCQRGNPPQLFGYGRVRQDYSDMEGGAISNIGGVVEAAREAIGLARQRSQAEPEEVVMGIAGEFVKGMVTSRQKERKNPDRPICWKEIGEMVTRAQQHARLKVGEIISREMGLDDIEIELLNSSLVEVRIDGYRVNNPADFQGKVLSLKLFTTFAPLVHVGALRTLARKLDLKLRSLVAEPFAVANSILTAEAYEFGALVIDIGGGTTDVALIRNGGIEGTRMLAMGGRAFTRSLAGELNLSLKEAERLKLDYSRSQQQQDKEGDIEEERERIVARILRCDLNILYEGLELTLQELAQGEALPRKIYFCGGGSALAGLVDGLQEQRFYETLPFFSPPQLIRLRGQDIPGIKDEESLLEGAEAVTPRGLAVQAGQLDEGHSLAGKIEVNYPRIKSEACNVTQV